MDTISFKIPWEFDRTPALYWGNGIMEIYFYCTYIHSAKGFFLTRLEHGILCPVRDSPPRVVRDFFSYERFRILWESLPLPPEKEQKTSQENQGSAVFCGFGALRGTLSDGRPGIANLAFLADRKERELLNRIVLCALGNYNAFEARVFQYLSVGGACGYRLDAEAFLSWLHRYGEAAAFRRTVPPLSYAALSLRRLKKSALSAQEPRGVLFAVYVEGGFERGRVLPDGALPERAFQKRFCSGGSVWEPIFDDSDNHTGKE